MTIDPTLDKRARIKEAVLSLMENDEKINQRSVAARAGVSYSSLTGTLAEVKEEIRAEQREMDTMPPAPDRVADAFEKIWLEACRAAAVKFDAEREATASALAEAKDEAAETFETLCEIEEERDLARADIKKMQFELDELRATLDDERTQRAAKEALLAQASARLSERDSMLERQLAEAKDAAESKATTMRDQEKRLDALKAELERERGKAAEAQNALEAKTAELLRAQSKMAELASGIKEFDQKRKDAQSRATAAMAERDGLSSELKSMREELRVKEELLIEAKARLAERDDLLDRIAPKQNAPARRSKKKDARDAEPNNQDVDTLPLPFTGEKLAEGVRPSA